jgi:hypothetical protein
MIENQIAICPEGFRGKSRPDRTDMLNALAVQDLRWWGATEPALSDVEWGARRAAQETIKFPRDREVI